MKQIKRFELFDSREKERFLYRVEINQDIQNAIEAGNQPDEGNADEKKIIQEGRIHALDSVGTFNENISRAILRRRSTEQHWYNDVGSLVRTTRNQVRDVLAGTLQNSPHTTPPTVADGVSNEYDNFVDYIFEQSNEAQNTVADTDFALQTLKTTQDRLKQHLDSVRRTAHLDQRRIFGRWWKPFGRATQEKAQQYFDARRAHVEGVLSDIQGRIEERKTFSEEFVKSHAERIKGEFELMTPTEKARFLTAVQGEINTPFGGRVDHHPRGTSHRATVMMEGLTLHQRIEIYREAKLDQTAANRNLETCERDDENLKREFNISASGTRAEVSNLDFSTIQGNLGMRNAEGSDHMSPEFIKEIEQALNDAGLVNRNDYFLNYPNSDNLNDYQKFIVYARIIQENRSFTTANGTTRGRVCDSIPRALKRKIAEYLQFIQNEESIPNDELEGFTQEFLDLESNVSGIFTSFNDLVTSGLNNHASLNSIQDLGAVTNDVRGDIESTLTNATQQLVNYENTKGNLSTNEQQLLEANYKRLEQIINQLNRIKQKHTQENNAFANLRKEYNEQRNNQQGLLKTLKDIENKHGNSRPGTGQQLPIQGQATQQNTQNPTIGYRDSNEEEIKKWTTAEEKLTQCNQQLSKIYSQAGMPPINGGNSRQPWSDLQKSNYNFQFIDDDFRQLLNETNANNSLIPNNRPIRTNTNNPTLIFRNYLSRKSNEKFAENVDATLETNRKKMIVNLRSKQAGSAVNLSCVEYQHGNPPTSTEVLSQIRSTDRNNCIVLFTTETGVVLSRGNNELLIVQEGTESKRVEVISMSAPSGVNLATEGLPKGFDLGTHQSFVATPTSILAI